MDLGEIARANGPFFLIVFALMSMIAFALIVWRWLLNYFARTNVEGFLKQIDAKLKSEGPKSVYDFCKAEPGMIPQLFATAIENGQRGRVAARNAMATQIELEIVPSLNRLLPNILLFAKVAPMVGLLGTVVGMILAFRKIAGATKVDPSALANDIGMALFTTAEGLLIAIPLIFFYSYFRERVHQFEIDLQRGAAAALELLPRLFSKPSA